MAVDLGFPVAVVLAVVAAWYAAKHLSIYLPRGFEYSLMTFFWALASATFVLASFVLGLWLIELYTAPEQPTDYLARGRGWFAMIIVAAIFSARKFRFRFHPPEKPGGIEITNRTSRKAFVQLLAISSWGCIVCGFGGVPADNTSLLFMLGSGVVAGFSASVLFRD